MSRDGRAVVGVKIQKRSTVSGGRKEELYLLLRGNQFVIHTLQ